MKKINSFRAFALGVSLLATTPSIGAAQVGASDVALGKSASQSSNYNNFGPGAPAAVDGNTNGNYFAGSVATTNPDYRGWWMVDLGGDYDISTITLWNRTDCCAERLSDFFVSVLASGTATPEDFNAATVWSQLHPGAAGTTTTFTPSAGTSGRYVKVQYNDRADYLQLAEVDVEGSAVVASPEPESVVLIATGLLGGLLVRRRRRT